MMHIACYWRRAGWSSLAIMCAAIFSACAHSPQSQTELFRLEATVSKDAYRPGEAAMATVTLTNLSPRSTDVRSLNFASLQFYIHPISEKNLSLRRFPVYSALDSQPASQISMESLDSQGRISRQFLFTRLTEDPGDYTFTVAYDPNEPKLTLPGGKLKAEKARKPLVWSNALKYSVKGERLYKRDSKGIILKEDVLRIAQNASGMSPINSDARLFWNQEGFLEWWVKMDTGSTGQSQAWFIHPYTGRVIGPAPLEPPAARAKE